MASYVYLGVARKNENATFVDIDAADSGREPTLYARSLLEEHRSCDWVEIWCDDQRVAVVTRPLEGPHQIADRPH
jgi:hypothetical protein